MDWYEHGEEAYTKDSKNDGWHTIEKIEMEIPKNEVDQNLFPS